MIEKLADGQVRVRMRTSHKAIADKTNIELLHKCLGVSNLKKNAGNGYLAALPAIAAILPIHALHGPRSSL